MNKNPSPLFLFLLLLGSFLPWTVLAHEVPYHEVVEHNHWLDYFGLIGIGVLILWLAIQKRTTSR